MAMTRATSALLLASLSLTGCMKELAVKPTEVPKLNGAFVQNMGTTQSGNTRTTHLLVSVAHVEGPDGRTVEVSGRYDLIVRTKEGREIRWDHPVISELRDEKLVARGSNRGEVGVPLDAIASANVTQPDMPATILASLVGGLVGGVLLYLAIKP